MTVQQPIRTAILSYGMSGEVFHAPLITAHPGFRLAKILERSKDKARTRYPEVTVVRTLDEILTDDTIDLIVVNTPHDSHTELAEASLRAGKHVIVEKPFTTTRTEGEMLIALAAREKKMLSVFHNRRWDGDALTVEQIVKSQVLGRLVEVEIHYDRYRPMVDWSTWKESDKPGAGILYNLGSHLIDQALTLFGMPLKLSAEVGSQRDGATSADFYDIRMSYPNSGLHVILKSSYMVREHGPRYVLHGEKGSFIKQGLDPQEEALKLGGIPGSPGWGTEPEEWWGRLNTQLDNLHYVGKVETVPGNYLGYYDTIYGAIREGKSPAVTPQNALDVIHVIEKVLQSSKEERTVYL